MVFLPWLYECNRDGTEPVWHWQCQEKKTLLIIIVFCFSGKWMTQLCGQISDSESDSDSDPHVD